MSVVIHVNNISKEYRLGVIGHGTLNKDLQSWWAKIRGKEDPNSKINENNRLNGDRFWALKDVSFEIQQGDRIGIIGRNGAGKSTLLKILSRVTTPSSGSIKIKGRVASLLEVGTGFHPELTGRENIYLNGAILGMTSREVKSKFDEIVDFAGIEDFIDTPVKRYSSGMYVRLAFAVAAHLDPEILIVDEVLAVGDANFQKKCLGKMKDVSKNQGRTVLFVSHNLAAISSLCNIGMLLVDGKNEFFGSVDESLKLYSKVIKSRNILLNTKIDERGFMIHGIVYDESKTIRNVFFSSESIYIEMKFYISSLKGIAVPNFHFKSVEGNYLFVSSPYISKRYSEGEYTVICKVPPNILLSGTINIGLALTEHNIEYNINSDGYSGIYYYEDHIQVTIEESSLIKDRRYSSNGKIPGVVHPILEWDFLE